jgi:hypothetical protein
MLNDLILEKITLYYKQRLDDIKKYIDTYYNVLKEI